MRVYQNSLFEEIAPAIAICSRGKFLYLGIMTHLHGIRIQVKQYLRLQRI